MCYCAVFRCPHNVMCHVRHEMRLRVSDSRDTRTSMLIMEFEYSDQMAIFIQRLFINEWTVKAADH